MMWFGSNEVSALHPPAFTEPLEWEAVEESQDRLWVKDSVLSVCVCVWGGLFCICVLFWNVTLRKFYAAVGDLRRAFLLQGP